MTTYINYETYVRKHIKASIGGYKLCDLSTIIIQQFYNDKLKNGKLDGTGGLSPKTQHSIRTIPLFSGKTKRPLNRFKGRIYVG